MFESEGRDRYEIAGSRMYGNNGKIKHLMQKAGDVNKEEETHPVLGEEWGVFHVPESHEKESTAITHCVG